MIGQALLARRQLPALVHVEQSHLAQQRPAGGPQGCLDGCRRQRCIDDQRHVFPHRWIGQQRRVLVTVGHERQQGVEVDVGGQHRLVALDAQIVRLDDAGVQLAHEADLLLVDEQPRCAAGTIAGVAGRLEGHGQVQRGEEGVENTLQIIEIHRRRRAVGPALQLPPAGQNNGQPRPLFGQRAILTGQEDGANLEQGDARRVAAVGRGYVEHRRQDAVAHDVAVGRGWVAQRHVGAVIGRAAGQQPGLAADACQPVAPDLLQAELGQQIAQPLFALQRDVAPLGRQCVGQ